MKVFLLLVVLLTACTPAGAECLSKFYVLSGTITLKDKTPAADAIVGAAWEEGEGVGGPALARTDSQGKYSLLVEFKPYSSIPGGNWYECKGQLKTIQVSSYSRTHYSPPISVSVQDGSTKVQAAPIDLFLEIESPSPGEGDG